MDWESKVQVNGKLGIYTIEGVKITDQIAIVQANQIIKAHNQKPSSEPPTKPGWYPYFDPEIEEWDCIQVRFTENYRKNEMEFVADTYHAVYIEDIKCELVSKMKGLWGSEIIFPKTNSIKEIKNV